MYKPEEYVVYGANGVCLITELCPSPFDPADERLFYVMKPVTDRGTSVIYTPRGQRGGADAPPAFRGGA